MPKLDYPVISSNNQLIFQASKPINHAEMLIAVPYKLALTYEKAMQCKEIEDIARQITGMFLSDEDGDITKELILIVFIMYEWQKGEKSFWFPYLNFLPEAEYFYSWNTKVISETYDMDLISEA
jgi:hypothetical protein